MTLKQRIARLILSPLIFIGAALFSLSLFLFPWLLVVPMHFFMFCYELVRLLFKAFGIDTPEGGTPFIEPFKSKLANTFVGIFIPIIVPFYATYLFLTEVDFLIDLNNKL